MPVVANVVPIWARRFARALAKRRRSRDSTGSPIKIWEPTAPAPVNLSVDEVTDMFDNLHGDSNNSNNISTAVAPSVPEVPPVPLAQAAPAPHTALSSAPAGAPAPAPAPAADDDDFDAFLNS